MNRREIDYIRTKCGYRKKKGGGERKVEELKSHSMGALQVADHCLGRGKTNLGFVFTV